jgi:hypothetical protein
MYLYVLIIDLIPSDLPHHSNQRMIDGLDISRSSKPQFTQLKILDTEEI